MMKLSSFESIRFWSFLSELFTLLLTKSATLSFHPFSSSIFLLGQKHPLEGYYQG